MTRTLREMTPADIDLMIGYFINSDAAFLNGMGVDPARIPKWEDWRQLLERDMEQPLEQRKFYYLFWELDGRPIGHSNINKLVYAREAYMHLHLWVSDLRGGGHGTWFIRESINRYFERFELQKLFCEPYALNPAPNRTLPKVGFELLKTYETTPGIVCFPQLVNRWVLTREVWSQAARY